MKKWECRCQVCGKVKSHFEMRELKESYRIFEDIKNVCDRCGDRLDRHVDYYGKKKAKDKQKVRNILVNGKIVNEIFSKLMFAGYY